MNSNFSRREFLQRAFLASAGLAFAGCASGPRRVAAPSDTILHASIGASGMAASDLTSISHHPFVKVVAIADVDIAKAENWKEKFPGVRLYQDWRQLLDKEKNLDSVNVSTPDHKIKEDHTWSDKDWGDAKPKPDRVDPVPAGLDWNGWLGVAADRPFIGEGYYHPGNWRRSLDFGTGTFGDMGCHIYDPVFNALALTAPISVRSEGPAPNQWHWANRSLIHYVFPGTAHTAGATVNVTWYDGGQQPPKEIQALLGDQPMPGQGSIFVGTKGVMLLPHIAKPKLLPEAQFEDFKMPQVANGNHYTLWLEAVRGNGKTTAGFDYSGPLTEAVLLGGVASRFPQTTLQWDSKALKFTNVPEAGQFLRRKYRRGWEVKGLS